MGNGDDGTFEWPSLPLEAWRPTRETLHMWTQIVGKIRLALCTPVNHWWHVPLYLTTRGLTTSPMPHGARDLQIDFDFTSHELVVETSDGQREALPLTGQSVASFYRGLMTTLERLEVPVSIWPVPVEVPERIPFDQDDRHAAYDPVYAHRFWSVLRLAGRALERLRGRFAGKSSPVHFFWGSFDLSLSLYSGRPAPEHPGAPNVGREVMVEAYAREEAAFGFWPGDARLPEPAFYAYAYPEPPGYRDAPLRPAGAYFHEGLGEFVLPYEAARRDPWPAEAISAFLDSAYEAAAGLAHWDRATLERAASATPPEHRTGHGTPRPPA
jgi:hypothetical protein